MKMISASSRSSERKRIVCLTLAACLVATLLSGCFREATPRDKETDSTERAPAASAADTSIAVTDTSAAVTAEKTDAAQPEIPAPDTDSYFANSLFIGDSVMEGISRYVRSQRNKGEKMLADAKFLTDVSGIRIADLVEDTTDDRIRYQYKGKAQELSAILADIKPSRIFLFLGMNDLSFGYTAEDTISRYKRLIGLLQKECPDVHLVVMTVTPKTDSQYLPWYCKNKDFGSPLLNSFAEALMEFCRDNQLDCVDANAAVRDEKGHLPAEYSNDGYIHLNDAGAARLIGALQDFARQEMSES
ncbi:MAG: hypothetical protein E7662_04105 [Ruminococcaceae bacterium]|nr:hypothetical protein [Oscillospiraceae bacterium]